MNQSQPNPPAPLTAAKKAALFACLEEVKWQCTLQGCNKNEQVIALILACLGEGITAASVIVGTITCLGYNNKHVGMMLHDNIGHLWHRDGVRIYEAEPLVTAD